jgi:hypothetical protein
MTDETRQTRLKAPFPWFGGKSRVAHLVWERFGDVSNYVEPFAGSLATLLLRPHEAGVETVNDLDCYLANFWRAVAADPYKVAKWADWPVSEADLHARHEWLVGRSEFREVMKTDPDFFDVKIAGWWVWGLCQWIGGGWCAQRTWRTERCRPHLNGEMGINRPEVALWKRMARGRDRGINRNLPVDGNAPSAPQGVPRKRINLPRGGGKGVHRKLPDLRGHGTASGKGVHSKLGEQEQEQEGNVWRKRPSMKRGGKGVHRSMPDISGNAGAVGRGVHASRLESLVGYFEALATRLRRVRVCCGFWERVLGPSPTTAIGVTAVFLDPPYPDESDRDPDIYSHDDLKVWFKVRDWAVEHGEDRMLRIALCGYEDASGKNHGIPANWECVAWSTSGGYGVRAGNRGRVNRHRERIWFSPHCLKPSGIFIEQPELI